MLDSFLSARFLTLLDADEDPFGGSNQVLQDLADEVAALDGITDGFGDLELISFSPDRFVGGFPANGGEGRVTVDGEDLGLGFGGLSGEVTGFSVSVDGLPLVGLNTTGTLARLEVGNVYAEIAGEFDGSGLEFEDFIDVFDNLALATDLVPWIETLSEELDVSVDALQYGEIGEAPALGITALEDKVDIVLGTYTLILEGAYDSDLLGAIETFGLADLASDGADPDALFGLSSLTGFTLSDAIGTLLQVAGDFGAGAQVATLVAQGTNGADDMRLAGTLAERIEIAGQKGNDTLGGSRSDDDIAGQRGRDELLGQRGDDSLDGGRGKDTLTGGSGDDEKTGGGGADDFVFGAGAGRDRVLDFQDNRDNLVLSSKLWDGSLSAEEVVDTFGRIGQAGHVQLRFDADTKITFEGLTDLAALVNDIDIV